MPFLSGNSYRFETSISTLVSNLVTTSKKYIYRVTRDSDKTENLLARSEREFENNLEPGVVSIGDNS